MLLQQPHACQLLAADLANAPVVGDAPTYVHQGLLDVSQSGHRLLCVVLMPEPGVDCLQGSVCTTPPCIICLVL